MVERTQRLTITNTTVGKNRRNLVSAGLTTDDYDYDFNGNLDKDRNKGLLAKGDIRYNYLNLPEEVIKGTESIKYIYDATGRKLAQEVYSNNGGTLVKTTDYIGELVYEDNSLQFAQTSEGRVLPDGSAWEYQYHLKDHLGNVRVTFTTKPQATVSYAANLETGTGGSGEGVFGNYSSSVYDLVDHTDAGSAYQKVHWLNGGASGRLGLTKSLSVMPGDRVSVTAYAKYMNLAGTGNTNAFAAALTAAFGVSSGSTGEQLKLYNGLNDYGLAVAGGDHPDDDDTAPKAFVTILLFDRNYNLLDAAWDQVTTDMEQVSATQKEPFAYPLSKDVVVHEPGFAYIFVSNEHPTYVDVYFDDVTVTHTPSPIVSASDYYPFGLTFNSSQRENAIPNRKKFNGIEEVTDLDLNVYTAFYRANDPAIGRWWQIDPKANPNETPYAFGSNNPIRYSDFLGDTINDEGIRNHKVWGKAYQTWLKSSAGKRFVKLYSAGGKYGHISVNLKLGDTKGADGTTATYAVNKETGESQKLASNTLYPGMSEVAQGKSEDSYLKFDLTFDENQPETKSALSNLENAESILHESQHLRINQQTLITNEAINPNYYQHKDWMKPQTSSWYQERVQFYQENSPAWKPDYERQLKQGKVKNEAEYIRKKVNGFMN